MLRFFEFGRVHVLWFVSFFFFLSVSQPGLTRTLPPYEPSQNAWRIFDPLGDGDTDGNQTQALRSIGQFGQVLSRALLRRRTDTPIQRFLENYRESFNTLSFSELYELEEVPWTEGDRGRKELYFRGQSRNDRYHLVHDTGLRNPAEMGGSSHLITIQPQSEGFVLRNERWTNVGPINEKRLHEVFRRFLAYFDFEKRGLSARDERLKTYDRLTENSHPKLREVLDPHLTVRQLGSVDRDAEGRKVNRVKIVVRLRKESFRDDYPDLYELIDDFLEPSGLRVTLKTREGDRLMQYEREGLTWTGTFATRRGLLLPVDPETGAVAGSGRTPLEARRSGFRGTISSWIHLYGMRFGMDGFTFTGRYDSDQLTWRAAERPALDLPLGFNLILSPFVSPFLEYLENGEDGRGILFREEFRKTEDGAVRVENFRLPLKNSPFLTFLMKLNSFSLQPFDGASRKDAEQFGQLVAEALKEDFGRELRRSGQPVGN